MTGDNDKAKRDVFATVVCLMAGGAAWAFFTGEDMLGAMLGSLIIGLPVVMFILAWAMVIGAVYTNIKKGKPLPGTVALLVFGLAIGSIPLWPIIYGIYDYYN